MTPDALLLPGAVLVGGALSARWNWWRLPKAGLPILMYHKVGDPPAGSKLRSLWVSAAKFRRQMEILAQDGYQPITFKDLYAYWDRQTPLPPKPILLTFDDGYLNNFDTAFPILREFGFRATLFVVVQTVGWDNQWHNPESEVRIPMISWDQLKILQKEGWEIGSHTMNHHNLLKLVLKEVQLEVEKSRRILGEFLGETPPTFAYPYGAGEDSEPVRAKVKAAGYRLAVGVHTGKWPLAQFSQSPFNLPRIFVRGDDNMFDFHLQLTRGRSRF